MSEGARFEGAAIAVENLVVRYGAFTAVDGIDLSVQPGEVVAVLGPNGAGKTSTVETLEGFRDRSSGTVRVLGEDPAEAGSAWRERIGIVLQESEPPPGLTAREAVVMQANYYSSPRPVDEVLETVGLSESADVRTRKLSGGQKRRLDLAQALVGDPELVFLDEPTTGFDPSARRDAWDMVEGLRDLGVTILLTTHYMEEAERLADRIVVIAAGSVIGEGSAAELAAMSNLKPTISWSPSAAAAAAVVDPGTVSDPVSGLPESLADLAARATVRGGRVVVETEQVVADVARITQWATGAGVDLAGFSVDHPTLEDSYLALTGQAGDAIGGGGHT